MAKNKYETNKFYAKEVFSRDGLIDEIKSKTKTIIFKKEIDKALALSIENEKKKRKKTIASALVAVGGAIGSILFPYAVAPILIGLGGALGMLGKRELKKYDFFEVNFHDSEYYLLIRSKDVNLKLDSIVFKGEVIK